MYRAAPTAIPGFQSLTHVARSRTTTLVAPTVSRDSMLSAAAKSEVWPVEPVTFEENAAQHACGPDSGGGGGSNAIFGDCVGAGVRSSLPNETAARGVVDEAATHTSPETSILPRTDPDRPPPHRRGLFIVVEGIDRCGKTTQLKRIMAHLERRGWRALPMAFPDRCTRVGQLLNEYLKGRSKNLSCECVHLLFSANRWEQQRLLRSFLESSVSIVCDRYAYSGIAYGVGAAGLDFGWARAADCGLIRPDLVFQIDADPLVCARRAAYGEELYEKVEVQQRVRAAYQKFFHQFPWWVGVDAHAGPAGQPSSSDDPLVRASIDYVTQTILARLDVLLDQQQHVGFTEEPLQFID